MGPCRFENSVRESSTDVIIYVIMMCPLKKKNSYHQHYWIVRAVCHRAAIHRPVHRAVLSTGPVASPGFYLNPLRAKRATRRTAGLEPAVIWSMESMVTSMVLVLGLVYTFSLKKGAPFHSIPCFKKPGCVWVCSINIGGKAWEIHCLCFSFKNANGAIRIHRLLLPAWA